MYFDPSFIKYYIPRVILRVFSYYDTIIIIEVSAAVRQHTTSLDSNDSLILKRCQNLMTSLSLITCLSFDDRWVFLSTVRCLVYGGGSGCSCLKLFLKSRTINFIPPAYGFIYFLSHSHSIHI